MGYARVAARRAARGARALLIATALTGCGSLSPGERNNLGAITAGLLAAGSPAHEVEQTYYLGIFDPQEQLPPAFYRIRVHGQSSSMYLTRFQSGWVHANLIDSLGTSIRFDKEGRVSIEKTSDAPEKIQSGRRLVMFGPEGFRESPADHRLVVVMGASPEKFFQAIDQTLASVNSAIQGQKDSDFERAAFTELLSVRSERQRMGDFLGEVKRLEEAP